MHKAGRAPARAQPGSAPKGRARGLRASQLPARSHPVSSLARVSEAMGADKSPREVLSLILKAARSITRASSASLMLIAPGSRVLRVKAAEGFQGRRIYSTRLRVGQGITGWVAETGVPLRIGNVARDRRYVRVQRGLRSELAVPLKVRGRVIGVISVDSTRVQHFTAEDEGLLLALAAHSSRLIQTQQVLEQTRRRAEQRSLLLESGRMVGGAQDLPEALERLTAMTARFCRAPAAAVYLRSEDGLQLNLAAGHGAAEALRKLTPLPVQGTLLGRVLQGRAEAVAVRDLAAEVSAQARQVLGGAGLARLLAVPLALKGRALGVLCVFGRRQRRFEPDERRLLAGVARSAALAVENAHAHRKMRALEESLRGAEKTSLMTELAAGLAHEIRNPLTSLRILLDSLARAPAEPGARTEDADVARRQLDRLDRIVTQYLERARARAAGLQAKPLDVNAVINESLLLLADAASEGTRLACALEPGALLVRGDFTQLSQVVYNLVLNALQAVGSGEAPPGSRRRVEVRSARAADGAVLFEVADDGPGLSEEVRARLFQPFLTSKKLGVGLGLSIVKRIVDAHGGELSVESPRADLGHGARFRVTLKGELE